MNWIKAFFAILMILIEGLKKVCNISDKDTRGQEIMSLVALAVIALAFLFCLSRVLSFGLGW